jgi:hypothetical protein
MPLFFVQAARGSDAGRQLEVTGAIDMPDANGIYQIEKDLRNGRHCFSRVGNGAIYFDGSYWKICRTGNGPSESGWNFSQKPTDSGPLPPLGRWVPGERIQSETTRDYSQLEVKVVGQLRLPDPSVKLTMHTAYVATLFVRHNRNEPSRRMRPVHVEPSTHTRAPSRWSHRICNPTLEIFAPALAVDCAFDVRQVGNRIVSYS